MLYALGAGSIVEIQKKTLKNESRGRVSESRQRFSRLCEGGALVAFIPKKPPQRIRTPLILSVRSVCLTPEASRAGAGGGPDCLPGSVLKPGELDQSRTAALSA